MADKTFTRAEVAALGGTCFVIDNVVYDVAAFLDEHPGGHEVLQEARGGDASEQFSDIGHSLDAKELMKKYAIGAVAAAERVERAPRQLHWEQDHKQESSGLGWKLPVLLGLLATLLYSYLLA
ncbi:unnamed protein product [Plutella xylostella]|uniref:Cytochrome b5 n=1 Tax=Plutella xylostella TaxID=51655 RepID=A0A8S4FZE3_PLUXY|nr:cytochrome b5 [Plutella xylostella]CAG9132488.1 unnamed protein product [Plutella xylostella]